MHKCWQLWYCSCPPAPVTLCGTRKWENTSGIDMQTCTPGILLYFRLPRSDTAVATRLSWDTETSAAMWIACVLLLLHTNASYSLPADSYFIHFHWWLSSGLKQKLHQNLLCRFPYIFKKKEQARRRNGKVGVGILFSPLQKWGQEQKKAVGSVKAGGSRVWASGLEPRNRPAGATRLLGKPGERSSSSERSDGRMQKQALLKKQSPPHFCSFSALLSTAEMSGMCVLC